MGFLWKISKSTYHSLLTPGGKSALQMQHGFTKHNMDTELSRLKLSIGHFALLIFRTECINNLPKKKVLAWLDNINW